MTPKSLTSDTIVQAALVRSIPYIQYKPIHDNAIVTTITTASAIFFYDYTTIISMLQASLIFHDYQWKINDTWVATHYQYFPVSQTKQETMLFNIIETV